MARKVLKLKPKRPAKTEAARLFVTRVFPAKQADDAGIGSPDSSSSSWLSGTRSSSHSLKDSPSGLGSTVWPK
jgi:hypothetical protein